MIQNFILFLSFLVLSIMSWIPSQDIEVKMDVPEEVRAGEEFIVTLNIHKGDIESFSRYTQSLPYGLTAERLNTSNADFSFEDQRVRIIWLRLPPEDSLTISYKVKVDPRLTGNFELAGDFAFVNENERNILSVPSGHVINILPNPSVADNDRINIDDYQNLASTEAGPTDQFSIMEVVRTEPVKTSPFEYTVKVKVRKGDLTKFAKIEEYIPEGFRVVEGESQNGIFSFNQGVVKILWMNLPEEPEFTISYRVVPDPGTNIAEFDANGSFSYIRGSETRSINIVEKEAEIAEASEPSSEIKQTDTSHKPSQEEEEDILSQKTASDSSANLETIAEETQNTVPVVANGNIEEEVMADSNVKSETGTETLAKLQQTDSASVLNPEKGVSYKVQVGAGHREINIDKYFDKRKVPGKVSMEFHNGWRKYTTGSFNRYRNARDHRDMIWKTTPIDGAFVAAYSDGKRITVQEALMISQQKWFQ